VEHRHRRLAAEHLAGRERLVNDSTCDLLRERRLMFLFSDVRGLRLGADRERARPQQQDLHARYFFFAV